MEKRACAGRGFTLLELMIVLTIIGIMITLGTVTYLSQVQKIKLQNDVREINQALQVARMRALSTGIGHGVIFVADQNGYYIFVDCNNDGQFTDIDTDPMNNAPVQTAEACAAAAEDPRMSGENFRQLNPGNTVSSVLVSETAVLFNNLGQTIQGTNPIFGDIVIRGPWDDGVADEGIIHINASGLSEVMSIRRTTTP